MIELYSEICLCLRFENIQKEKEMATDKKQNFTSGLKKIREKVKNIKFGEDWVLAQIICIMSCLFFVGYDMNFLYQQVQIHGFDVASMIRDVSWERWAGVYLFFAGADASIQVWSQLFKKMKNNIHNRMQDETNLGR